MTAHDTALYDPILNGKLFVFTTLLNNIGHVSTMNLSYEFSHLETSVKNVIWDYGL